MNQKFSGFSRPSLCLSQNGDGAGPPPFEKLDIEAYPLRTSQVQAYPVMRTKRLQQARLNPNSLVQIADQKKSAKLFLFKTKLLHRSCSRKWLCSKTGMVGVIDSRANVSKKILDEWERRKAVGSMSTAESYIQDTSQDKELARQLQEQLDLEDIHGMLESSDAEGLRMSMFSFSGPEEMSGGRRDFRGRGWGRGRGRERGRGGGRF